MHKSNKDLKERLRDAEAGLSLQRVDGRASSRQAEEKNADSKGLSHALDKNATCLSVEKCLELKSWIEEMSLNQIEQSDLEPTQLS